MVAPSFEQFDYDPARLAAAVRNWRDRALQRETNKIMAATGRLDEVETPARIAANRGFREEATRDARRFAAPSVAPPVGDLFQERIVGNRDFLGIEFLEMAAAVARFVGRVRICSQPGMVRGYGTGFVVSPRLLLTNNHVLPSADTARVSAIELDYQRDRYGQPLPVVEYALQPEVFFLTDAALDFSLVAVAEASTGGIPLSRYAWVRLRAESGKALIGDALNIVQHPRGEMKQLVLRSNKLVDCFDTLVHYETDTEPGSSGSPVFSDGWLAVALHHSGVPKTNDTGDLLDIDGRVWRQGRDDPERLAWAGNEGIRVSSLVEAIERATLASAAQRELRRQLLEFDPPNPRELAEAAARRSEPPSQASAPAGSVTVTIPLQITVSLGTPVLPAVPSPAPVPSVRIETPPASASAQERPQASPAGSGDDAPSEYAAVLDAARAELGQGPGILSVDLGYVFENGWITDRRALVVTLKPGRKGDRDTMPALPEAFQGLPIQTIGPSLQDLVALKSGRAVAEAVFAEADLTQEITYAAPPGAKLETVTDTMRVVAHLSPDSGWPLLEKFLGATRSSLTVGMYDFGAKHILDALLALKAKATFKTLTLTLQKGESVGEGTKADDLHDDQVVESLQGGFGSRFKQAWVKIGAVNGWVASSYHIKVAVRDRKSFWLSSGNWQSSNQPLAAPLAEAHPKKDWLQNYNREWHAIVEHASLAKTLESYLQNDYDNNRGTDGREDYVLPDLLVAEELFAREAAEDPKAWRYFEPFDEKRRFTVTPLLTPDNYHRKVLDLVRSAEDELLIQNQTFNAPKASHARLRELVEAVLERQRAGVAVRIIFRLLDRSQVRKNLSALKDMGFDMDSFRVQKNCHTKGIVVDERRVLLGSQNWSNDGVSQNRDASLLFEDAELAAYFKKVFEHDWIALADKDIGAEAHGLELATSLDETPPGMIRLTWKDYMETW